jgi:hypothetical protein
MSLWVSLQIGDLPIGNMEIQRQRALDLSDPEAIANVTSKYKVKIDGKVIGKVDHRYGDGAWILLKKAMEIVESDPGYATRTTKRSSNGLRVQ